MKLIKTAAAMVLAGFALNASAATISGTQLQDGLDAITLGGQFLDVNADQYGNNDNADERWGISSSGASVSTLVFEFAGFAPTNTFGIYDVTDPTKRLEIFNGADSTGAISVTFGAGTATFTTLTSGGT